MAHFDKFANLDRRGWDNTTATLTGPVGKHVHIGLWGEGPAGEKLDVQTTDHAVCVVHEEPLPAHHPRWRHLLITPRFEGKTTILAYLPGTKTIWAMMTLVVTGKTPLRMVFFPGEKTQGEYSAGAIYLVGAEHGGVMWARGGLDLPKVKVDRGGHTLDPTPAGNYVLGPKVHVTTKSWPMSVIPWGAALRINPHGEVEFEERSGHWTVATGRTGSVTLAQLAFNRREGIKTADPLIVADVRTWFIDDRGRLWAEHWRRNDFGAWGWNLTLKGKKTGYWLHTTAESEELAITPGAKMELFNSHGCVHISPVERDEMIKLGFLKGGIPFEVRPYSEKGPY